MQRRARDERGARPRARPHQEAALAEAHADPGADVGWLLVSATVAFVFTRAVALPLFLIVFFAVWLGGYGVLARLYR